MSNDYGIAGRPAPEFGFNTWLANAGPDGLKLAEIAEPIVYLYNFQSWCPGCHSHGFPTLAAVRTQLVERGLAHLVKFVVVQTVFEGHGTNTADAALESLERHGLDDPTYDIALGHDSGHPPVTMVDYRTGGTPWTVIIGPNPDRTVLFDGFQLDADAAVSAIEQILATAAGDA